MTSDAACPTNACCSLRVLVVEDDPEVLEASLEALELLGHWATGVRSAEGALDRFLEGAFDVLMADIGLPALSGLELADKLQARCALPIIFATASQEPDRPIAGSVWLCKPFGLDQLAEALRQAAQRRTAISALAPMQVPVPPLTQEAQPTWQRA
ncbi:response regulator [Variovorax guangxiensis]|uniref:response regulator transcription factor n=1 Tax=Variovorax guangxiensis TaxID=1775474 RepID=UPI00286063D4|nr:response regulator [Variovorax guangxiensis]MDR6859631.1 CheY-like chemotaxis protein [Variovorax guangxiensis]